MANASILAAFERMWYHITNKLNKIENEITPMTKGGTGATSGSAGLANMLADGKTILSPYQYGDEFPENPSTGQIFFKESAGGDGLSMESARAVNLLSGTDFTDWSYTYPSGFDFANDAIDGDGYGHGWIDSSWYCEAVKINSRVGGQKSMGYMEVVSYQTDGPEAYMYYRGMNWGACLPVNRYYTIAVKEYDKPVAFESFHTADGISFNQGNLYFDANDDGGLLQVELRLGPGKYEGIDLYEGEFTAETLPSHQYQNSYIERIKSRQGAVTITKIWENASSTSSFPASDLYFDLSDTQWLAIIMRTNGSSAIRNHFIVPVGGNIQAICKANAGASSVTINYVRLIITTTSGVSFESTIKKSEGADSISSSQNSYCIPVEIYAIKGVD